jgi:Ca2+-binding RTX toxin-like protein
MRLRRLISVPAAIALLAAGTVAASAATVAGTGAADTLVGAGGDDRLRGLAGDDLLDGGAGNDDLSGGDGRDVAVYPRASAVHVTIDNLANDGEAGEQDNVQLDVEGVYGGDGSDRITGSDRANLLDGDDGDDVLDGGAGTDELHGGAGADRLLARDGMRDTLDCGPGDDVASVDTLDAVRNCEIVDRRPVAPRVSASVRWAGELGTTTTYTKLLIAGADPAAAEVTMVCTGGGCPFARRSLGTRRDVTSALRRARLRPGSRIELRLTARGRVGAVIRVLTRRDAAPRITYLCLVGGRASSRCPQ